MDINELYRKPVSYKFSEEEKEIIKEDLPKQSMEAIYAVLKHRKTLKPIVFAINYMPYHPRNSGIAMQWEIIHKRPLSEWEYEDEVTNYGIHNNRQFMVWHYDKIEDLIAADKRCGVITPEKMIARCRSLGFYGNRQTNIFENQEFQAINQKLIHD